MQSSNSKPRRVESGDRLLDSAGFLFHNAHERDGYERSKGCRFCAGGLEAISVPLEKRVSGIDGEDGVDEGDRVDEEGATTSAPDNVGAPWWAPGSVRG